MIRLVVDASVAIKWYLPEIYEVEASRLLNPSSQLLAPDLLFSEIGNILWKHTTRNELSAEKAITIITSLSAVPLQIFEARSLMPVAFEIACQNRRTFYDSLYLALAKTHGCRFVTADLKLYNSLKDGPLGRTVLWIENI